ncbi:MAG: FAD-binding oxidoreductase [Microthrixaceae bacterium]
MSTPPDARALRELEQLLDPTALWRGDDPAAQGHLHPWRGAPDGRALAVVRPGDTEQVRAVVGWARRHRTPLVPQGANTGLVGASTPPPSGSCVVVSTDRLRRPPRIDVADRAAIVDAGVRLSELDAAAAPHGLHLPIDLGADPSIGGMVATNTGGSRMLAYGDMRRRVLGLRAVLADEARSVVDELTTLRKHNTGPSYTQLVVGTGGAFGIVTEVALELEPVPRRRAVAWLAPRGGAAILSALTTLEHHHGRSLTAFEVMSAPAIRAALALPRSAPPPFRGALGDHVVLVELSGGDDVDDELLVALDALQGLGLLDDAEVPPTGSAWSLRHSITEGLSRQGVVVGFDVSVPRGSLPELVTTVRDELVELVPTATLADFGHWGDGGVHCNVLLAVDDPAAEMGSPQRAAIRELVLGAVVDRFGGSFSAEHGVGPLNADWWRRCTPAATRLRWRQLTSVIDPVGILGHPGLPYRDG